MNTGIEKFRGSRDTWMKSDDGRKCADIFTLENAKSQTDFQKYLKTRIEMAYAAGFGAGLTAATELFKNDLHAKTD